MHTKKQQYSTDNIAQGLFSFTGCSNSDHKMATETHMKRDSIDLQDKILVEIISETKK